MVACLFASCRAPDRCARPLPCPRPVSLLLLQALQAAGLEKGANAEGHAALDKTRVGVLVGSGMGGLSGTLSVLWPGLLFAA